MTSGGACSLGSVVVGRGGGGGGVGGGWMAFVSGVSVVWEVALMSRLSSFISRLTSFFLEFEFLESLGGFLFIYGGNCRGCDSDGFGVDRIEHERVELVLVLFGYGLFRGLDRFPLVF